MGEDMTVEEERSFRVNLQVDVILILITKDLKVAVYKDPVFGELSLPTRWLKKGDIHFQVADHLLYDLTKLTHGHWIIMKLDRVVDANDQHGLLICYSAYIQEPIALYLPNYEWVEIENLMKNDHPIIQLIR